MSADPAFEGQRALLPALQDQLQHGERVFWAGKPDLFSLIRTQKLLWLTGGALLAWATTALLMHWISSTTYMPLALVSIAFLAGPLLNISEHGHTAYAITNQGALIVHGGMRPGAVRTPFSEMDEKFEVLETGYGAGHVYFASGRPKRLRDVDYTGKLAFRNVLQAHHIARLLDAVRKR
jgi:hypothetical protein